MINLISRYKPKDKTVSAPVVILSAGRSGSTLLQRIVNTSPNLVIWGEHGGMLSGVANSYQNLIYGKQLNDFHYNRKDKVTKSLITGSYSKYNISINWMNSFDKENSKDLFRNFIFSTLNQKVKLTSTQKCGFKEILYSNNDNVVNMLVDLFPDTKFLFSIRNPLDAVLSMMFAFSSEDVRNNAIEMDDFSALRKDIHNFALRLKRSLGSFNEWTENPQINSMVIKYEDLISQQEKIIPDIFNFLGTKIPVNAYEPLAIKLESTKNYPYYEEIKKLVLEETPEIRKILGSLNDKLYYDF